jgi:hypothetical protein
MNSLPSPFDHFSMDGDVVAVARAALALARRRADVAKLSKPELVALLAQFAKIHAELAQEVDRKERLLAKQSEDK